MNLIHLYIHDHKALFDLNVPFSSQFKCGVTRQGKITLRRRDDWVDFYDGYKCQAIIGRNGAGKSSILEALCALDGESQSQVIAIFHEAERDHFFLCFANLSPLNYDLTELDVQHSCLTETALFLNRARLELVHVNSLPDDRMGFSRKANKPNSAGPIKWLTVGQATRARAGRKQYFNRYLRYFADYPREPYQENIRFMFSCARSTTGFIQTVLAQVADSGPRASHLRDWLGAFAKVPTVLFDPLSSAVGDRLVEINAPTIIRALFNWAKIDESSVLELLEHYVMVQQELRGPAKESLAQAVARWIQDMPLPNSQRIARHSEVLGTLAIIVAVLEDIGDLLYMANGNQDRLDLAGIVVEDFATVERLRLLAGRLPRALADSIHWGWRGASTGELARAHIFSELFNYLSELDEDKTAIILIDEADLYLHPEWQRKFLGDLLTLFRRAGSWRKRPQLVVCTHSPIIVSDFLADDIVSLRSDADGIPTCGHSTGFGSSITDIYMADMHIESTFGEHARAKLAHLLGRLEAGRLSEADRLLIGKISNHNLKNLLLAHDQDQQDT